jgi:hypothetical protein
LPANLDTGLRIIAIGIGATAVTDFWSLLRRRIAGIPLPNFGLVGRWLIGCARGRFRHESIAAAPRVPGEALAGWVAHYLIGVTFAALLVLVSGPEWLIAPTLWPALAVGIGTVVFPFFVMQPGMGAGIAASRAPNPMVARIQSILTHVVFGLGMYVTSQALRIPHL